MKLNAVLAVLVVCIAPQGDSRSRAGNWGPKRHRHRHGESFRAARLSEFFQSNVRSLMTEWAVPEQFELPWPIKKEAVMEGDLILGGLMMVHEREDTVTCGRVMPQGGVQALETMLYTLDVINNSTLLPNIVLGAHILDDCDKDTYGLEMAVDFIKGIVPFMLFSSKQNPSPV